MNIIDLLLQMTQEEKIAQLIQLPPFFYFKEGSVTGPSDLNDNDFNLKYLAGSTLGITDPNIIKQVQDDYLENSRLKIPLIFMHDVIHGLATNFPIPLALSATFNPQSAFEMARASAVESFYSGLHVTFSPMVDISRDSRWGRIAESNGEDTFLSKKFARAYVEGYQGNGVNNKETIASCVKHFAAYGLSEAGRDYNNVDISENTLRQYHLPVYKSAIDAGVEFVMTAFNPILNIPCTVNKKLLTKILKEEMMFNGIVISDWNAVIEAVTHNIAIDNVEAGKQAFLAGCTIEMASTSYAQAVKELLIEKVITEEMLNNEVLKVLDLKNRLGLFDDCYRGLNIKKYVEVTSSIEHQQLALELAQKSVVLLENNGILPIKKQSKIAVVGKNQSNEVLHGMWKCNVLNKKCETLHSVLTNYCDVIYYGDYFQSSDIYEADIVIYAGGEFDHETGEAKSKMDLELPKEQIENIHRLKKLGKKIVFLNYSGRGNVLSSVNYLVDALLNVWFLGDKMSQAICNILFGEVSPSAKLPISLPRHSAQMPLSYMEYPTGRYTNKEFGVYESVYSDIQKSALYNFGYGLTYTKCELQDINITKNCDKVSVVGKIANLGIFDIEETVQVYVSFPPSKVVRPLKELKGLTNVVVASKDVKRFEVEISISDLYYFNNELESELARGTYKLFITLDNVSGQIFELSV